MTLYELIDLHYRDGELVLKVASLVQGDPDGYIGVPLTIDERSKHFRITFSGVGEFKSTPEPCFSADGKEKQMAEFVFECLDSQYLKTVCPVGVGAGIPARHFNVVTESVVIDVIAKDEPVISVESA